MKGKKYHISRVGSMDILLSKKLMEQLSHEETIYAIKIIDFLLFKYEYEEIKKRKLNATHIKKYYRNVLDPKLIGSVINKLVDLELLNIDDYDDIQIPEEIIEYLDNLYEQTKDTRGGKR